IRAADHWYPHWRIAACRFIARWFSACRWLWRRRDITNILSIASSSGVLSALAPRQQTRTHLDVRKPGGGESTLQLFERLRIAWQVPIIVVIVVVVVVIIVRGVMVLRTIWRITRFD